MAMNRTEVSPPIDDPEHILIVDDDEDACQSLSLVLRRQGYLTETARTGHEALQKAEESSFDIVLLDSWLPDMGGIELLTTLKQAYPASALLIVADCASLNSAVQALDQWADGYVARPLDVEELLSRIRVVLEKQRLVKEKHKLEAQRDAALHALQQRNRQLELLHDASRTISSTLDLDQVLSTVLEQVRRLLGIAGASVWLVDTETGELACRQATGPRGRLVRGWRLEPGDGLVGWVASHGESLIVPDTRSDERHFKGVDERTRIAMRSIASVPLRVKRGVIGVLQATDTHPARFDASDLVLLEPLASSAAVAIDNARLYEQVRATGERLQVLSRQLVEAQENERRRIARELHDEIGQALTTVIINLQAVQRSLDAPSLASYVEDSIAAARHTLDQVRDLSLDLRPSLLDDLGLVPALRWYSDRQSRRAGLSVQFHVEPLEADPPVDMRITCFRIVQEALTNVVRHAQAEHVVVELRQRDRELELTVRDDGHGFDVDQALERASHGGSLGLLGMQERTLFAGGQMHIQSARGRGTEIRVSFPLPPA